MGLNPAYLTKIKKKLLGHPDPDFAFIIHALTHDDFLRVPGFSFLKNMPKSWNDSFDRLALNIPPVVYGHMRQISSAASGKEINGIIYGIPATPKVLKEADPAVVYKKIKGICNDAAARGARIIGLGAYTKIIGDQGFTINQNSPIPVTTGNSLSVAATLWALDSVVRKLGLLKQDVNTGQVNGTAMIIGATGSIGQASAKILSGVFNRICLIAPRLDRLEELKSKIHELSPACKIDISTDANELVMHADVVVTATSAYNQRIVDIMKLKPGAVVCDCSRPLDFSIEDAAKRPDILIIESGEVILPGIVKSNFDMGLSENSVYACLAETAVLALDGTYEPFTVGSEIELGNVERIFNMARYHGVQLAPIRGHFGIISDDQIERVRAHIHALNARNSYATEVVY